MLASRHVYKVGQQHRGTPRARVRQQHFRSSQSHDRQSCSPVYGCWRPVAGLFTACSAWWGEACRWEQSQTLIFPHIAKPPTPSTTRLQHARAHTHSRTNACCVQVTIHSQRIPIFSFKLRCLLDTTVTSHCYIIPTHAIHYDSDVSL